MLVRAEGERQFLLTDKQRVYGTAAGLIKWLRDGDRGILAHEFYLMGEANFIGVMRKNETPHSLAAGLTDAQLGEVYAHLCEWVKGLARKGHYLRKRRTG
jgi:hypothetical protein